MHSLIRNVNSDASWEDNHQAELDVHQQDPNDSSSCCLGVHDSLPFLECPCLLHSHESPSHRHPRKSSGPTVSASIFHSHLFIIK